MNYIYQSECELRRIFGLSQAHFNFQLHAHRLHMCGLAKIQVHPHICNFPLLHFSDLHTHHIFASVCKIHFATQNLTVVTEEEALKANPKTTIKLLNYDVITEFLTGLN